MSDELKLTLAEKKASRLLLVIEDDSSRQKLQETLLGLGFGDVTAAENYPAALKKLTDRSFTHSIFEISSEGMDADDFLAELLRSEADIVAIPASNTLDSDQLFELLIVGARGYFVLPGTIESLESCLVLATKGEPIPKSIVQSPDRNKALVGIMVSQLDQLAEAIRQAKLTSDGEQVVQKLMASFRNSASMAQTFRKGSLDEFLEALEKYCIEQSMAPATRLGKIRNRLRQKRKGINKD